MKHIQRDLPSNCTINLVNDLHIGNYAFSEGEWNRAIPIIKRPKNSFVICQGDMLESICINDKRFSLDVHRNRMGRMNEQRDELIRLLDPIGSRILMFLDGNHEMKLNNIYKPIADVAAKFNSIYADGMFAKFIFPTWRLGCHHGWGSISSKAGDAEQRKTNNNVSLRRKLRELPVGDCDIVSCGHFHKLICARPDTGAMVISGKEHNTLIQVNKQPTHIPTGNDYRIPDDERYYISSGAFLKGYLEGTSTYVEQFGLSPSELGFAQIVIKNDKIDKVELIGLGW